MIRFYPDINGPEGDKLFSYLYSGMKYMYKNNKFSTSP